MKLKKKKKPLSTPLTKVQINKKTHQQTMRLIEHINEFIGQLINDMKEYSAESKVLTSKIVKEWASSIETGNVYDKSLIKTNQQKNANFIKSIAEFIE